MQKQLKLFTSKTYCIDSDSLIELKRYPKDVFPSIWDKVEQMSKGGELISHLEVYKEITIGSDELVVWCKRHKKVFKDVDECQLKELKNVKTHYGENYWTTEINKTGPWADPWIIALGICEEATVITEESNKPNKIPFVADLLKVKSLNLLNFFREIGIKL